MRRDARACAVPMPGTFVLAMLACLAVIAANAMLIILSTAIASDTGSLALWLIRLFQFALAGAFAVGMMTLLWYRAIPQRSSPIRRRAR